jgi:type IV secretory pathway TrbD component
MLLWIILGFGWLGILVAGVSLFRFAGFADKKVRRLTERPRRRDKEAA